MWRLIDNIYLLLPADDIHIHSIWVTIFVVVAVALKEIIMMIMLIWLNAIKENPFFNRV